MSQRPNDTKQIDKFRQAARDVETDDREEAFDAIVKKIAKAPKDKQGDLPRTES